MTVIIGILALIGLAVVGGGGWAFAQGVRDGLAAWRGGAPPGGSQPLTTGEPSLSLSAALPRSYQAGQLAGEVASSWRSSGRAAVGSGVPASSSWAAALALGSELSLQRQEAGRAMQAAMAQVLRDDAQAMREAAGAACGDDGAVGSDDCATNGGSDHGGNGTSGNGAPPGVVPDVPRQGGSPSSGMVPGTADGGASNGAAEADPPAWPTRPSSRRPRPPRPSHCRQQRPTGPEER